MPCSYCGGRLEQLDQVPRGINGENLCAAGTGHDLVAEPNPLLGEAGDLAVEVVDDEVDAVPASGARSFPIGHRPAGRALRAGQQEAQVPSSDIGERRTRDTDGEAEVPRVEVDAWGDVVDQIAHVLAFWTFSVLWGRRTSTKVRRGAPGPSEGRRAARTAGHCARLSLSLRVSPNIA